VLGMRECRQSSPAASCRSSVQLSAVRSEPGKVETSDVRMKALLLCACAVWKYSIAFVIVCLVFRRGRNGRSKKETGMLAVSLHRCASCGGCVTCSSDRHSRKFEINVPGRYAFSF
jgi:hypothetical protein